MTEYRMLANIRAHSLMVARLAELLALARRGQGAAIDVPLTVAAALLHDIAKSMCLDNDRNHAAMGRDLCLRHGYPELAPLVFQHVVLDDHSFPATPLSAKELVYYADKRVNHDQVVSLDERRAYIVERYGRDDPGRQQAIWENFQRCRGIETAIFEGLDFTPSEVASRLAATPPSWEAEGGRDTMGVKNE